MADLRTPAVHSASALPPTNQPAVMPLYESAAWTFESLAELEAVQEKELPGVVYGSLGGPNHAALERLMAVFEGAEAALCANGGMTAIMGCLRQLVRPGDRVLAARDLFGPTFALLTVDLPHWGGVCDLVDATELDAVERALRAHDIDVVYAETISNPRLRVVDIAALAELTHHHGALLVIDNTFASPALCQPLALGADIVVESLTKYVAGHYDCLAGVIVGRAELVESMRPAMLRAGQLPSPFEAWLCVRGAQTFPLRVAAASESAGRLASWLEGHAGIDRVLYPGLVSHPDHEIASSILRGGFGGVLSFELAGGRPAVERLVDELQLIRLVSSLGGIATTVNHPTSTSHRNLSPAERHEGGIHDGLVRLAVGIEAIEDVVRDLERALATVDRAFAEPVTTSCSFPVTPPGRTVGSCSAPSARIST